MKNEVLMRAMSEIDEDLILEAHEAPKRAKTLWIRWGAAAACLLMAVLLVPRVVENGGADFFPGSLEKAEADMELMSPETADKNEMYDGASDDVSGSIIPPTEEDVEEEVLSTGEMIQLALAEQGGAYPIGITIENKHGSVVLTDRWGETIAMRVTLLRNERLSIYSATSGIWKLTVNGESVEKLPDRVGAYEIVIDFSGDPTLDMIFIENFGVFSISDW